MELGRYWVGSVLGRFDGDWSGTSSPVQSGLGFPPVQAAQFLASTSSTPPKRGVVGLNTAVGGPVLIQRTADTWILLPLWLVVATQLPVRALSCLPGMYLESIKRTYLILS